MMLSDSLFFLKFLLMSPADRGEAIKDVDNELKIFRSKALAFYFLRWLFLDLPTIFKLSGTDKHHPSGHWYAPHYAAFFSPFRRRKIRLLEIGIGGYGQSLGGRSINAWRCYFPFARMVACDIQDKSALGGTRVTIEQLDQSKAEDLKRVTGAHGPFHIIIDDGSHLNEHQIFTFEQIFASLEDGGVYVVEDTQTSFWPGMGGELPSSPNFGRTCIGYFLELAKYLNHCEFPPTFAGDEKMRQFADEISTISFHHNLIFVRKDRMKKWSNVPAENRR